MSAIIEASRHGLNRLAAIFEAFSRRSLHHEVEGLWKFSSKSNMASIDVMLGKLANTPYDEFDVQTILAQLSKITVSNDIERSSYSPRDQEVCREQLNYIFINTLMYYINLLPERSTMGPEAKGRYIDASQNAAAAIYRMCERPDTLTVFQIRSTIPPYLHIMQLAREGVSLLRR